MDSSSLKILDLGCGRRKVEGALGIDRVKLEGVDIVHDLTRFPYPLEDNSIDKIFCRHILEHFDVDTRIKAIEEIYRILKEGGQVEIRVPHAFSVGAFRDPTHKSYFTNQSLNYFNSENFFGYYSCANFAIVNKWMNINIFNDWAQSRKFKHNLFHSCPN